MYCLQNEPFASTLTKSARLFAQHLLAVLDHDAMTISGCRYTFLSFFIRFSFKDFSY